MRKFLKAIAAWMLITTGAAAWAEPWSERLGFEPGAKVVMLDLRELGITWEMNEAAKRLLSSGKATSGSVVVTGPWFEDIATWSQQHPDMDLGISIALTNPYHLFRWHLITTGHGQTSLVDGDGFPWSNVVQLASSAHVDDVKMELDAQIMRAREAGINPTHLSGYYGTVLARTDLAEVFLSASRKYWLPAPVVEITPELMNYFEQQGVPIDPKMTQLVAEYPLPKLDDIRFSPLAESYEAKRAAFVELIQSLKPGLTQIVFRPADESRGLHLLGDDWQQRVWDARLLEDPEITKLLKDEKIQVTNWREVMRRFETTGGNSKATQNSETLEP